MQMRAVVADGAGSVRVDTVDPPSVSGAPGAVVVIEHARGAIMGPGGVPGIAVERETTRRYGDTEITVIWTPGEGT